MNNAASLLWDIIDEVSLLHILLLLFIFAQVSDARSMGILINDEMASNDDHVVRSSAFVLVVILQI